MTYLTLLGRLFICSLDGSHFCTLIVQLVLVLPNVALTLIAGIQCGLSSRLVKATA